MMSQLLESKSEFTSVQLAFNLLGKRLKSQRERDPTSIAMTSAGGDESTKGYSGTAQEPRSSPLKQDKRAGRELYGSAMKVQVKRK